VENFEVTVRNFYFYLLSRKEMTSAIYMGHILFCAFLAKAKYGITSRCNIAQTKQRTDKPHLLFHVAQSTLNSAVRSKTMRIEISLRKRAPATQEGGPCGRAYGGKWGHGRGESGRTRALSVE
jgi:hypothetical protein